MRGMTVRLVIKLFLSALAPMLAVSPAHAVLNIEITQGLATGLPIAIVPFAGESATVDLSGVIDSDLSRSGRFKSIPQKDFVTDARDANAIEYKDWRWLKAEAVVMGIVRPQGPNRFYVEMQLHDPFKQARIVKVSYVVGRPLLRAVAHQMSDIIYEKLTGEPGAFNTRIAYVTREGAGRSLRFRLFVADADGFNERPIVASREPIMAPAWSPDGRQIAYVSFEERRSIVYVQNVADGKRRKVAQSPGINSAPAWSPDGRSLALVLSKGGNPDIYVMRIDDGSLRQLTRHTAIDTEPAWAPNGRELVFTSDRGGRPQIYRMSATGDNVSRVTFEGDYNARAVYAPDGRRLALVTGGQGGYRIGVLRLEDGGLQVLTDTSLDESPTFAPNGRLILYATQANGRGVLATVSADGQVRQTLKSAAGDIREPAWSPATFQSQNKGVNP